MVDPPQHARQALTSDIDDAASMAWLQEHHAWSGLEAIGWIRAERRIGTEQSVEDRYYLLSRSLAAPAFADAVSRPWGIENHVHWVLMLYPAPHRRVFFCLSRT